jgi:UDP-N-acetylmuramoyl-tripeptide--D-alanyl-D-alanine ligase
MEPLVLHQIAAACHGEILTGSPDMVIRRIGTDSRQTVPGDLFLALVGDHHDGHDHIPGAIERGAVAVLGARGRLTGLPAGCPVVAVADTRQALGDLAAAYRSRFRLPTVAVAGSNGKTTTKDLMGAVLAQGLNTLTSEASYNNAVGVPLTLLRIERQHQAAVVEVGTNHPGELAPLLRQVQPTHGVLTSLGREHLEFFGSFSGVLEEEGWLAELLPASGTLFVNADAPGLEDLLGRTRAKVVRVGWGAHADWQAASAQFQPRGMRFAVRAPQPTYDGWYQLPAWGRHQVLNALLALAVGADFGLTPAQLQAGLDAFHPPKMRLQLSEWGGIALLDDCYNANADSMNAALETLKALPCRGRRWAVLGDMAELGAHAPAAHAEVGRRAASAAQGLIAVGRMASVMARAAREAGLHDVVECGDVGAAAANLAAAVRPGDLVLVKASRATRLERVVEQFKAQFERSAT